LFRSVYYLVFQYRTFATAQNSKLSRITGWDGNVQLVLA